MLPILREKCADFRLLTRKKKLWNNSVRISVKNCANSFHIVLDICMPFVIEDYHVAIQFIEKLHY